jgi:prepilin-type N-terminal cleavage/methylation domain-containing protein
MNKKGFTLIELLIVIGVLGILAAGLMAAVDPFEQLKKARDANNRNAVIELHNAMTRYYATHGALPWDDDVTVANPTCNVILNTHAANPVVSVSLTDLDNAGAGCVKKLEDDGELKNGFTAAVGSGQAAKVFISSPSQTSIYVCFSPEGKGLFRDPSVIYDTNGADLSIGQAPTCSDAAKETLISGNLTGTVCHWCAR